MVGREAVDWVVAGPVEMSARTPSGNYGGGAEEAKECRAAGQMGCSSLLLMEPLVRMPVEGRDRLVEEEELMWSSGSSDHVPQIWDFNSGEPRNQNECSRLELGVGASTAAFRINSYSELLQESSFGSTYLPVNIYETNCLSTHDLIKGEMASTWHKIANSKFHQAPEKRPESESAERPFYSRSRTSFQN